MVLRGFHGALSSVCIGRRLQRIHGGRGHRGLGALRAVHNLDTVLTRGKENVLLIVSTSAAVLKPIPLAVRPIETGIMRMVRIVIHGVVLLILLRMVLRSAHFRHAW